MCISSKHILTNWFIENFHHSRFQVLANISSVLDNCMKYDQIETQILGQASMLGLGWLAHLVCRIALYCKGVFPCQIAVKKPIIKSSSNQTNIAS